MSFAVATGLFRINVYSSAVPSTALTRRVSAIVFSGRPVYSGNVSFASARSSLGYSKTVTVNSRVCLAPYSTR